MAVRKPAIRPKNNERSTRLDPIEDRKDLEIAWPNMTVAGSRGETSHGAMAFAIKDVAGDGRSSGDWPGPHGHIAGDSRPSIHHPGIAGNRDILPAHPRRLARYDANHRKTFGGHTQRRPQRG